MDQKIINLWDNFTHSRISRQEKDSTPVVEQEPQRLVWSRTEMRLMTAPICSAIKFGLRKVKR